MSRRPAAAAAGVLSVLVLAARDGAPAGEGLPGRLVSADDTGLGAHSLEGGTLVAVPARRAPELWAATDEGERPVDLAHAYVVLDEAGVEALDGVRADVTDAGRFRLDAPAGPAVVCWMEQAEAEWQMVSRGCSEVDLPADGRRTGGGEGGFSLRAE